MILDLIIFIIFLVIAALVVFFLWIKCIAEPAMEEEDAKRKVEAEAKAEAKAEAEAKAWAEIKAKDKAKAEEEAKDPFLQQVISEKERIDSDIVALERQQEREIEEIEQKIEQQFGDSKKLKDRLSKFALEHGMHLALNALWEEIKHYPSLSKREDWERWNKLDLTGISGSREKEINSVEFVYGTQHFKITNKKSSGFDSESYWDLSFFEDGNEVFAVDRINSDWVSYTVHNTPSISAFKREGNWAKVLLKFYGKIQIKESETETRRTQAEAKAEEIKSRFKG